MDETVGSQALPATILVIKLYPRETECIVCEAPLSDCLQGVPIYEDLLLHNDYDGDWGGFDACPRCFAFQNALTEPMPLDQVRERIWTASQEART